MREVEGLIRQDILNACDLKFRKIAMIVGEIYLERRPGVSIEQIHETIIAMCHSGEIDHQGDIMEMRYSEIRRFLD